MSAAIDQVLAHLEPVATIGALVILVGMLMFVPGVLLILGRKEPAQGRPPSRSELTHRLDG